MGSQKSSMSKPFGIMKLEVWQGYLQVEANKGAPGVDEQDLVAFGADLKNNLYKIWNRMSSGSYVPPPVRAVPIPKPGGGTRMLGVPTIADRVAQTVVANRIGAAVEPVFHLDSYGYWLGVRLWRRWRHAGGGAGATAGWLTWTWRSSSTPCRGT